MNKKHAVVSTLFLVASAAPSFAHDTWLQPRATRLVDGKEATIDLTSGVSYPKSETAITRDRLAMGGWRTGSAYGGFDTRDETAHSLALGISPSGSGVVVVFASTKPKLIELDADEVREYLIEINVPEEKRAEFAEAAGGQYRETFSKHAKTFVRLSDGDDDASCLSAVGLGIEFIPQRDPTNLAVGDELVVKAIKRSDEIEGLAVNLVNGKTGEAVMKRTNQSGMVSFPITSGGWWMVRATELRRQSDGSFESDFSTMTFFVDE